MRVPPHVKELLYLYRVGAYKVLDYLRECGRPLRWREINEKLINEKVYKRPNTLSQRLKELTSIGLIRKITKNEPVERYPAGIHYEITRYGLRDRSVNI